MKNTIHGIINNGPIIEGSWRGRIFFRWGLTLLLVCFIGVWSGCGGGGGSSSDNSNNNNNNNNNNTGTKSGLYEQNGGDATENGKTYAATETNQSSVYVYGAGVYTLTNGTLTKTGDMSSEENSNFYGDNAIALAEGASTINLTGCNLTSDSDGSNGVFAYQKGSVVNVHDCTISTTGSSARGVDATYGGTINIYDSEITTTGDHCSALATDRYDMQSGAPKINAYRVTAEVSGQGSADAYSTGEFYIEDCHLTSNGSEAAVIEGTNSITLLNTDMTVTKAGEQGVMVYQSMSGDALGNTGTFKMTGGSLTVNGGPYLLNTNDQAYFTLEDVDLSGSDIILTTGKISWNQGAIASNGGISHFNAKNQVMAGDFIVDGYGNITADFSNGSSLNGAIDPDNSTNLNGTGTAGGYVSLTLEDTSAWTATANSYVDTLEIPALTSINAGAGITITCHNVTINSAAKSNGTYPLTSGGSLVVQ
jgi:hypothetical protein